jgi:pimeloyl-ACP methyl ester carboxylesterase
VVLLAVAAAAMGLLLVGARPTAAAVRTATVGGDGALLAVTLVAPDGRGPVPGVVLLPGAGAALGRSHRPVADRFAAAGVAALVFDKRGSGRSTGSERYSYARLAADARALTPWLAGRAEVRDGGVFLWGLSEGAFVAPLTAAGNRDVAGVIAVSASGLPPSRQQHWADQGNLRDDGIAARSGAPSPVRSACCTDTAERTDGPGPIGRYGDLDFRPDRAWRAVEQPVLGVWGGRDEVVPARESRRPSAPRSAATSRSPCARSRRPTCPARPAPRHRAAAGGPAVPGRRLPRGLRPDHGRLGGRGARRPTPGRPPAPRR